MKKIVSISIVFVMLFVLQISMASAIVMFLDWGDYSTTPNVVTQGENIIFDYESLTTSGPNFGANSLVETEVTLMDYNLDNALDLLAYKKEYQGSFDTITYSTENLEPGRYTILGYAIDHNDKYADGTNRFATATLEFTVLEKTVSNNPPVMQQVVISPEQPFETDALTGFCRASDADGNRVTYNYRWTKNGQIINQGVSQSHTQNVLKDIHILSATQTQVGDTFTFSCQANDGKETSDWMTSSEVIVDTEIIPNNPPQTLEIDVQPKNINPRETIQGFCKGVDVDNDPLSFEYAWFRNNNIHDMAYSTTMPQNSLVKIAELKGEFVSANDQIKFACRAYDGNAYGVWLYSETVTVNDDTPVNTAPYFQNLPTVFTRDIADSTQTTLVRLSTYAFDNEGDTLSFRLDTTASNNNIATCSLNGQSQVVCTLKSVGTTNMDVIVSDGDLESRETLTLHVTDTTPVNTAPYFQNLPTIFNRDIADSTQTTLVRLSTYAFDNEGDTLSFRLDTTASNNNIATCSLNSQSQVVCTLKSVGTTRMDVIVSDGDLESRETLTLHVTDSTPVNEAPIFKNLPTQFTRDLYYTTSDNLVRLSQYAYDANNDALTYGLDTSNTNTEIADCELRADSTLFCSFSTTGTTTVRVSVSDGEYTTYETLRITVIDTTPVNTAPYFKNMATSFTLDLFTPTPTTILRLAEYGFDAENDALTYAIDKTGMNTNIANCQLTTTNHVICTPYNVGTTSFRVSVSDGEYTTYERITINVLDSTPVNTAPYFQNLPTVFNRDIADSTQTTLVRLSTYAFDNEGDALTFRLDTTASNNNIATCTLNSQTQVVCTLKSVGTTNMDVIVSDGDLESRETLTLHVTDTTPVNEAPMFKNLPTQFTRDLYYTTSDNLVRLSQYAYDANNDALTYGLDTSNTNTEIADCQLRADSTLFCSFSTTGTTTVRVSVSDGEYTTYETLRITVIDTTPVNTAPYFQNLPTVFTRDIADGTQTTLVRLSTYAFDNEGDALTFRLDTTASNNNIATCTLNSQTQVVCTLKSVGTTRMDVIVNDGDLESRETLTLHVTDTTPVNEAPMFKNLPTQFTRDLYYTTSDNLVRLSQYAYDANNDALTYGLDTSNTNTEIADCELRADSTLFCSFSTTGTTTVRVSVSDGEYTTYETLRITVTDSTPVNTAPYFQNLPTIFTRDIADSTQTTLVRLSTYAFDNEGDALSFRLDTTASNNNIATCTLNSQSQVVCTLKSVGTTNMDVIVSDGELESRETLTLHVTDSTPVNEAPIFKNLPTQFTRDLYYTTSDNLVRLSQYAYDANNDALTYGLDTSNTNTQIADCQLRADSTLFCSFSTTGTTTVRVSVSDGEYTTYETLRITVTDSTPVNTAPYFRGLQTIYNYDLRHVDVANLVMLSRYGFDDEQDSLTYAIDTANTNQNIMTCTLLQTTDVRCAFHTTGTTTIRVSVSDGEYTTYETLTVNVIDSTPVNTAPYFKNLPTEFNYDLLFTNQEDIVRLSRYAHDDEYDQLTYRIGQTTNPEVATCHMFADSTIRCSFHNKGTTSLDVFVSDGQFETKATLYITVDDSTPVNTAPYFKNLPTQYVFELEEQQVQVVRLSTYAHDDEDDALTYSLDDTYDKNVVSCSIKSDSTILCNLTDIGQTNLRVRVSDGVLQATALLSITVIDSNNYGEAIAKITGPNTIQQFESATYDASQSRGSFGSEIIRYNWTVIDSNNNERKTTTTSPYQSISFSQYGEFTIKLDVLDEFGKTATDSLQVTVEKKVSDLVAIINAPTYAHRHEPFSIDAKQSYAEEPAYIVSYVWFIYDDENTLQYSGSGIENTVVLSEEGNYKIYLTIVDSTGETASAEKTIHVIIPSDQKEEPDFGIEKGLRIRSIGVYGHDFERARVGDDVIITGKVQNFADEDIEGVRMTFTIPEFGIRFQSDAVDVKKGSTESFIIRAFVPDYVVPDIYYPYISFANTNIRKVEIGYLEVTY